MIYKRYATFDNNMIPMRETICTFISYNYT